MTSRAKWDAWSAANQSYGARGAEAEERYLGIARDLGWTEGALVSTPAEHETSVKPCAEGSSEDIWDSDTASSSGGGGLGLSVSAMAPPPLDEQDAKTLHGLAVSNNAAGLAAHLDAHPDTGVDEIDQHVRPCSFPHTYSCLTGWMLQGYTPLHLACDRGNSAAVELLLSRGADRSLKVSHIFFGMGERPKSCLPGSGQLYGLRIGEYSRSR